MYQVRCSLACFAACGNAFADCFDRMNFTGFDSSGEASDPFSRRRPLRPEHPECFAAFVTPLEIDHVTRPDAQRIARFLRECRLTFRSQFETRHEMKLSGLPYL
jgi:hypothetical protein